MLILSSTSDIVRVVTSATADIEVHASWADNNAGTVTPGRTNTASITTATTTTVVGSPGASQQRNVKHLNIYNNAAATSCLVTVEHFDGTTAEVLFEVNLLAGETLLLTQAGVWLHYDINGGLYPAVGAIASQADMEAATSVETTVSPGRAHFHPGVCKAWAKCGVTGNILASYNMTSVTDTGAGRATFVIGNDMSSADYATVATIQRSATALAVTNLLICAVRSASTAAGSVEIEVWDGTATTAVQEDPTSYSVAMFGDQ